VIGCRVKGFGRRRVIGVGGGFEGNGLRCRRVVGVGYRVQGAGGWWV